MVNKLARIEGAGQTKKNHAIDIDMVKMHPDSWRGPIDIAKKNQL